MRYAAAASGSLKLRPAARNKLLEQRLSLQTAKTKLSKVLSDETVKVIALSGEWGTGKTHLWLDVQKAEGQRSQKIKDALYVSLFGVSSLQLLKTEIAYSNSSELGRIAGSFMDKAARKVIGSTVEEDIIAITLPRLLKDKLVVLDDIERKNSKLEIDEVLGFIDIMRQSHGTRFLLLLNEARLGHGAKQWDMVREKVIDEEVRLNTSPLEAVEIAIAQLPTPVAKDVREASVTCGLVNIRVIIRVIRVVNGLFGAAVPDEYVAKRLVPRIVLLSAIHYQGIADGPTIEYVLNFDVSAAVPAVTDSEESKARKKHDRLMHDLRIDWVDDFEKNVAKYLTKGEFDQDALDALQHQYISDAKGQQARDAAEKIIKMILWCPELSVTNILTEAEALIPLAARIPPRRLTDMIELFEQICGTSAAHNAAAASLVEKLLQAWEQNIKQNPPDADGLEDLRYNGPFHARMEQALDDCESKMAIKFTLLEASKYIGQQNFDGVAEATFLKASVDDYKQTIVALSGEDLRAFTSQHFGFIRDSVRCRDHIGAATDKFVLACHELYNSTQPPSRLPEVLRRVFAAKKLIAALETGKLEPLSPSI